MSKVHTWRVNVVFVGGVWCMKDEYSDTMIGPAAQRPLQRREAVQRLRSDRNTHSLHLRLNLTFA